MSMRWTEDQLAEYQERNRGLRGSRATSDPASFVGVPDIPDPGPERDLQSRIEKYCEDKGWYYFHDRSRGDNRKGHPDIVVALPFGRTLWCELKARGGRLRKEQERAILQLVRCGHEAHVVRSFRAFLRLVT
jgi:hypothetical protein